jgi:hypothetical protein
MRTTNFKRLTDRPTDLTRITLTTKDGDEQIVEIDDDLHYILAFIKVGPHGGKDIPMEVIAKGSVPVVGELVFRLGERHPELLDHCARRMMEKNRAKLKAKGIDPGAKEFENAPGVGGTQ